MKMKIIKSIIGVVAFVVLGFVSGEILVAYFLKDFDFDPYEGEYEGNEVL